MKLTNKGIGLAGAMVAVGITAAAGVLFTRVTLQNTKSTKAAKNSLDLNGKIANITNRLLRDGVCSTMLAGQSVNYDIPENVSNGPNGIGVALNQALPGTSLITRELKFISKGGGSYAIRARFEKDDKDNSFGPREIMREFPISVTMSGSVVTRCHSDVNNAIDSALSLVETNLPQCIFVEGSTCDGSIFDNKQGEIVFPLADKYRTCYQKYKRHCAIGGTSSFVRNCETMGWTNQCKNGFGKVSCYTRKNYWCENKVRLNGTFKTLTKCCKS